MPESSESAPSAHSLPALLGALHLEYPERGIVSLQPATKWDFGTVVGNGVQGALAFCRPRDEFVLSHEELFLPLFPFQGYLPLKKHFETIRQLVIDGKAGEAQQLIRSLKMEHNFPHYNTTDPFVGACALDLLMAEAGEPTAYARTVNFASGEAVCAWQDGQGLYHRDFFVSRADDVLVVRHRSPTDDPIDIDLRLREIEFTPSTLPKDHNIYEKTIDHCEGTVALTRLTHRMVFKQRWERQPVFGCTTVARIVTAGGSAEVTDNRVCVRNAEEVLLLLRTVPHRNGETVSLDALGDELDAIAPEYDALLARHAAIHGEMFHRCALELAPPQARQRTGETLQAGSSVGATDPALVEQTFDAARYGIIASTGTLPPALQGVWTGTWKPRWSGDYTLNGNVQSMVAASLIGNHVECQQSLMDYLDSLMDDFRENARELLGFRGPLIPWRSSTHGKTHFLAYRQYHHNFPGVYWFAGAAWFAQIYYDYYLHTGDEAFFQQRLKPFLLDSAALYEDFLTCEEDGEYILAPDSSAENETGNDIWMAPNPTMTIAAIKQLLRTVVRHADKLGATDAQVAQWQTMISKLPDYAIGENGALKEWTWPGIENEEAHRHASHLYPLYFDMDPDIARNPALQEACRVAIEKRIEPRRPDNGGFMAFGFTQLGMSAAHLGDTAHAYECTEYLVNSYWSPVLVSQHNQDPDGPDVLNLDISGGLPAVIISMLVQVPVRESEAEPWRLHLLPCLPQAWPRGRLRGARCRGGFEVDLAWEDGGLKTLTITSLRGAPLELALDGRIRSLTLSPGETKTFSAADWE